MRERLYCFNQINKYLIIIIMRSISNYQFRNLKDNDKYFLFLSGIRKIKFNYLRPEQLEVLLVIFPLRI